MQSLEETPAFPENIITRWLKGEKFLLEHFHSNNYSHYSTICSSMVPPSERVQTSTLIVYTEYPKQKKDLTWILYKAVKGESKMAVEFSRRPFSLLLSLWLSIFNLDCSCNWLEGQQGGTLLVGWVMPHGSQCAGSPLPLQKHFCCNAEISPCTRQFISLQCGLSFFIMPQ